MARSIAAIQAQIISNKNAQPELDGLNSTSKFSVWNLWTYIIAVCIGVFEQLLDSYVVDLEKQVSQSAAASALWVQSKMFAFQYDATNPQIVQLINTVPQYPTINVAMQLITACSVNQTYSNNVQIKVAKGNPLSALTNTEVTAAQSYINTIGAAGIKYVVLSSNSDKIYIQADVYYQGQYSAIIQTNVIAAINSYLTNLSSTSFNSSVKMSDLENVIRSVTGVNDCVLNNVRFRIDTAAFVDGVDTVLSTATLQRQWYPVAGYVSGETTSGKTFADSLNFVAQ
jgi:hypothetical protein